eukprot:EST45494.1 Hypothetical protein SS50377_14566 [Spironucleus salmonicida]
MLILPYCEATHSLDMRSWVTQDSTAILIENTTEILPVRPWPQNPHEDRHSASMIKYHWAELHTLDGQKLQTIASGTVRFGMSLTARYPNSMLVQQFPWVASDISALPRCYAPASCEYRCDHCPRTTIAWRG